MKNKPLLCKIVSMSTEADTCRKYVLPKLIDAGWDNDPHSFTEQRSFTDGRIVVSGDKIRRKKQKRADYLLRYTRDFPIAVIETKADYKSAGELPLSFCNGLIGEEEIDKQKMNRLIYYILPRRPSHEKYLASN